MEMNREGSQTVRRDFTKLDKSVNPPIRFTGLRFNLYPDLNLIS